MKKFKKIAASCFSAIAILASSTVSAFAANPNQAPAGPCGYFNGRINVSSSTPRTITGTSWTTQGKAIPDIITVKVDVDDYSTGALLFSFGDTKYNTSSVTKARTQAVYVGITATAFGGHACTKNGVQYACYTAEYSFSI